jgi:hypothetical protein
MMMEIKKIQKKVMIHLEMAHQIQGKVGEIKILKKSLDYRQKKMFQFGRKIKMFR